MRYVCSAVLGLALTLIVSGGCGSKSDDGPESATAAINGSETQEKKDLAPAGGDARGGKPAPSADALHPVVVLDTSLGEIKIVLDKERAPQTVDNFLAYVAGGFYDQTIFHQVFKGYVLVGGGYTADLKEKTTHTPVYNEARKAGKNRRGTIAMVRKPDVIDSATSQFLINVADNPNLDFVDQTPANYGFCVFGTVSDESLAVIDKIAAVAVTDKRDFEKIPVESVVIKSVRRIK